ncbi:hypothetical protein [Streptomyces sp. NPDC059783]|uniref:hypothetical protein n=1 Tax=Streptomyces sp. NPDC059783 TaxID=3346944 RepID=UPI00365E06E9
MRIRMKVAMSGLRNGQPWPAVGETTELPTAEAAHLCASGIAEEVQAEPAPVETATAPPAETTRPPEAAPVADTKRGRGRPRKAAPPKE